MFGPGSRAEVPVAGVLNQQGRPSAPFSGRLDRLAGKEDADHLVDFELGAAPLSPAPAHVAQLALYRAALAPLYPRARFLASLVYLDGAATRRLSDDNLRAALDSW